jgi:titin
MPLGNSPGGVLIDAGAADNLIGGTEPGAGNLISGNKSIGVVMSDSETTRNTVQGNFIGTDVTGSTVTTPPGPELGDYTVSAMPETCPTYPAGEEIEGWVSESDDPLAPWSGISVLFKGTDECPNEMLGEASLIYRYKLEFEEPTQLTSIVVSGGNFNGPDNTLRVLDEDMNVLGTTATFESPYLLLEGVSGSVFYVEEYDTSSEYRFRQSIVVNGPVPLGNHENGIALAWGASDNLIGGTDPGAKNLISGNNGDGVAIIGPDTTGNIVQGNYIGTDVTGTVALGNLSRGIIVEGGPTGNLIGGTGTHAGNLISGNEAAGIGLFGEGTEGNQIQGNFIGTDITGMSPLGNGISDGLPGVRIGEGAAGNLIGGTEPGAGNTIAFNGGPGIALSDDAGSGNSLLSNSVFLNEGLGIDLGFDDVSPNDRRDRDAGPNDLQNFPVITAVRRAGTSVMIDGTLDSTPSMIFRLEFFSNEGCDPSGYGEGQAFLGSADVETSQAGKSSFNITLPVSLPEGAYVTATATDPGGSTSEFSGCSFSP